MTFERHATLAARAGITGCFLCLSVAFTSVTGLAADIPEGIRRIEAEAASCQSAAAAARVYAVALTSSDLSDNDRAVAEARREHWIKLADEGRRRVGRDWLTDKEREVQEKEADRFIEQSFEMLRLGNGRLAEDHLKEASRRYLESGRADMLLGLIYAMVVGDNRRAATHFKEAIDREPGNAYAYNNFAITALAARKYSVAIRYFRRALELMPDSQELSDNLAVTLGLVGAGQLILPEKDLEEVSNLYRFAIHDLGLQPYQPPSQGGQQGGGSGSSYGGGMGSAEMGSEGFSGGASLPPSGPGGGYGSGGYGSGSSGPGGYGSGALGGEGVGPGGPGGQGDAGAVGYAYFTPFGRPLRGPISLDPATVDRLLDDPDEMTTQVWSGTGVAVGDGYVLTTLDVVGDATKVLVRKPGYVGVFLDADVVATSDETGLVLLDCMDLDVPAMPVAAAGVGAAGGKVLVGGFAGGLSERLTGTMTAAKDVPRGGDAAQGDADLIVAFPKRETADACGFGGIVLAATGELVGVVEGTVSAGAEGSVAEQAGTAGGGYGVGAGAAIIRKFLDDEMDDDIAEVSSKPGSWKDVVDAATESAVFLYAKKIRPGKPKPPTQQFAGGAAGGFGSGFGGSFAGGYGDGTAGEPMMEEGAGYGSSAGSYGSSQQGYGSQPPGLSPASMGMQSPGSSPQSYGSGSQPPGSSPGSYGSQPPGSSPGSYGSQPPGSSPGSYGSQPPGSSPGSYGSQPPGSSPQSYGSQPPGSSPQSYGSGSPSEEDPTAGENAEMEGDQGRPEESEGASFAPSDYPLAEQTVLGGTLTLKLPSGFEPMDSQMLQTKYPGANRPTLVYTNSTGSINIAINHTQNAVQPDQLKQLHQALDSATRQQVPDGNWRFSGFQHYAGREWVQMEFLSDAADTQIENLMAATSVDGRMLLVSFNVTRELAGDWLPVGKEIIKSLVAGGK